VGSLTGAVASQRVTEALKGSLSTVGNRAQSVKAQGSLTARQTRRAGSKDGLSDPAVPHGRAVAQRIKGTLGITG
jgi:lipopolysaccharide/colanic/teichoic acid biosynthesis glycosyltransferase